jgi:hypothetical protein
MIPSAYFLCDVLVAVEAQAYIHAARISLNRRIDKFGQSGENDDGIEGAVDFHTPHAHDRPLKLAPRGVMVLSVPNVAHWTTRWALARGRFDYTPTGLLDETHLRPYTAPSLARLLATHGLSIVAATLKPHGIRR